MALNIIVETVVKTYNELAEENFIYPAGTIIFDKEGFRINESGITISGVKIADGILNWSELEYLNITSEIVSKWRTIAEGKGITTSKLITLPDMTFAYVIVDAEQNSELIQEITNNLATQEMYYEISKEGSFLQMNSYAALDLAIPKNQEDEIVSGITFIPKENTNLIEGTKTYLFKDAQAWGKIDELKDSIEMQLDKINEEKGEIELLSILPNQENHASQIDLYLRGDDKELYPFPSGQIILSDGYKELEDGTIQYDPEIFYINLYHKSQGKVEPPNRIYTQYKLPIVEQTSENKNYDILTTNPKSIVPIANGGTSATNALNACQNLKALYSESNYPNNTQNIYTNLAFKKSSQTEQLILGNKIGADSTYQRGMRIGDATADWAFYAKTVGSEIRYCIGNDNVRVVRGTNVLRGAAWNDYAEAREVNTLEAGRVVVEKGNGSMVVSSERLMPSAKITSDTFGFIIGETETCKTPIAVCGRVLAYPNEDKNSYSLGDAVCSGPNGTVSKMTREEIINYPERIIGTVSEIPNYEVWGEEKVKVNGRIWIYVK